MAVPKRKPYQDPRTMDQNVYGAFRAHFPEDRGRIFAETEDGRRHSYADIEAISGRYARLLDRLGVRPGDRVAGLVDKSAEAIFLYLACLRSGAIYMPLNTAYRRAEVAHFLTDAEPKVAVCAPALEGMVGELARASSVGSVLTLDGAGGGSLIAASDGLDTDFPVVALGAADPNSIVYTSGTTGRPKGAIMTNGLVIWNAFALADLWGFAADDVLLHANPIAYGLFGTTNLVLVTGGRMILVPKFDADAVVRLLPRATAFVGVPTYYTRLLAHPGFTAELCRGMRLFVTGSAPMRGDVFEAFRRRTGHTLLDRYGLTETLLITSNPLHGERLPETSGRPLPGVEVRVTGEDGRPLPTGEIGMIEVRESYPFAGYWRLPDATAKAYRDDGFYVTGDLGRIHANGYVSVVGRGKDMIISGGLNVYPKEVETCVNALDGVAESAVIGLTHPDFGEGVVAVVEPKPGARGLDEASLIRMLKDRIAGFKVPKRIFFVDEMPRNALGKIQKAELRARYRDTFGA